MYDQPDSAIVIGYSLKIIFILPCRGIEFRVNRNIYSILYIIMCVKFIITQKQVV